MVQEGEQAVDFSLQAPNREEPVSLGEFSGRYVVLYFYPKDNTPGCTTQACGFRDQHQSITEANAVILGVSRDTVPKHAKFTEKYQLPFLLLSDPEGEVCAKYGVLKEKRLFGKTLRLIERTTFLIDPKGKVVRVYRGIKVKNHAAGILEDLQSTP